jgi:hypothetical protein
MGYLRGNRLVHLLVGELNLEYNDARDLGNLGRLYDGESHEASACPSPHFWGHGPNLSLCLDPCLFPCHIDEGGTLHDSCTRQDPCVDGGASWRKYVSQKDVNEVILARGVWSGVDVARYVMEDIRCFLSASEGDDLDLDVAVGYE